MSTPHDTSRVPLQQLLGRLAEDLQAQPLPPWQARSAALQPTLAPPLGKKARPEGRPWRVPLWPGAAHAGLPLAWGGALACVLVLLGAGWLMVQSPHGPGDGPLLAETRPLRETGFWPVVEPDRWAGSGADGAPPAQATQAAWVVRTELPAERLAVLGLPYDPGQAARPVRAELLLHASGDVLAVRVLP